MNKDHIRLCNFLDDNLDYMSIVSVEELEPVVMPDQQTAGFLDRKR